MISLGLGPAPTRTAASPFEAAAAAGLRTDPADLTDREVAELIRAAWLTDLDG